MAKATQLDSKLRIFGCPAVLFLELHGRPIDATEAITYDLGHEHWVIDTDILIDLLAQAEAQL